MDTCQKQCLLRAPVVIRCRSAGLSLPPLSPLGRHCEHRPVDPQDGAAAVCPPGLGWTQTVTHHSPERDARTTPPESPSPASLALRSGLGPPRAWCCWNPAPAEASGHLSPDPAELLLGGVASSPPGLRPQRSAGSEWRGLLCTWRRPASTRPLAGPSVRKPGGRHRSETAPRHPDLGHSAHRRVPPVPLLVWTYFRRCVERLQAWG